MSVFTADTILYEDCNLYNGEPCFFCGQKLQGGFGVCWMGAESTIYLHVECAIGLSHHLVSDGMKGRSEIKKFLNEEHPYERRSSR